MSHARAHRGRLRIRRQVRAGQRLLAPPGVQRPGHAPCTTRSPIGHHSSITGAELGRTIPPGAAEAAGPTRSAALRPAEFAGVAGPAQVVSSPKREFNGRAGCSSPSARSTRAAGRLVQGRVSTARCRAPSRLGLWSRLSRGRSAGSADRPRDARRRDVQGGGRSALRGDDRQRPWRCLRDRRTTGFPQVRAARAALVLSGWMACVSGQQEGE